MIDMRYLFVDGPLGWFQMADLTLTNEQLAVVCVCMERPEVVSGVPHPSLLNPTPPLFTPIIFGLEFT